MLLCLYSIYILTSDEKLKFMFRTKITWKMREVSQLQVWDHSKSKNLFSLFSKDKIDQTVFSFVTYVVK